MPEQVVTITKTFEERGNNSRGPWIRFDVRDAGGNKYQTFDEELGKKAKDASGSSVRLTYEEVDRNGYTNRVIKSIEVLGSVNVENPTPRETDGDRQLRIMRQSALERAILAVSALDISVSGVDDLYEIAEQFVDYFVNGVSVEA